MLGMIRVDQVSVLRRGFTEMIAASYGQVSGLGSQKAFGASAM